MAHLHNTPRALVLSSADPCRLDGTGPSWRLGHWHAAVGGCDGRVFRDEWLPMVSGRYPEGHEAGTPSGFMVSLLHDPERMVVPEVAAYPAHLHIDLLPEYQRAGWGPALMETLFRALAAGRVDAVHLCMVSANTDARAFYQRLGFTEIAAVPDAIDVTYLGRRTVD